MNPLSLLFTAQRELLAARARTNDLTLSQQAENGKCRLVRCEMRKGRPAVVTPLSEWVSPEAHLQTLRSL